MHRLRHPVRAIREPFGTAGLIVACVALIAALGGTALAAKGALTGKQKKEVEKIAKKFAGKPGAPGAPGPVGPQGAVGPKGDKGDAGQNGTNGTNGTNGEAGMCSEAKPECTLASGGMLTGVFSAANPSPEKLEGKTLEPGVGYVLSSISFPVRVSPAPTVVYSYTLSGFHLGREVVAGDVRIFGPNPEPNTQPEVEEDEQAYLAACPGSASEPLAEPGFLCIYQRATGGTGTIGLWETLSEAATQSGVVLAFVASPQTWVKGSWAVSPE
jgi:hypothetical protein